MAQEKDYLKCINGFKYLLSGYRKIPGNNCRPGLNLERKETPCEIEKKPKFDERKFLIKYLKEIEIFVAILLILCLVCIIKGAFYNYVRNDLTNKIEKRRERKKENKYKRLSRNMNVEKITEESVEDEEKVF
jgi:hypothetical protein